MDEITSRNIKGSPIIEIDPRFFFPDNILDLRYSGTDVPQGTRYTETPELINSNTQRDVLVVDGKLQPPSEITVVGQAIRVLADGSQTIDVTIDVTDDMPGMTYNVRINKA